MMLIVLIISAVLLTCFLLFGVCGIGVQGVFRLMLGVLLGNRLLICGGCAAWCVCAYDPFPIAGNEGCPNRLWKGRREYIRLPDKGRGLDVGRQRRFDHRMCERQPGGKWSGSTAGGKEYASFNKVSGEQRRGEELKTMFFWSGNAVLLHFPDESFDAVTSNYVYHNIARADKRGPADGNPAS